MNKREKQRKTEQIHNYLNLMLTIFVSRAIIFKSNLKD